MSEPVGLIAGLGRFPVDVARSARSNGRAVVAIAIRGLTDSALESEVERCHWVHLGDLDLLLRTLRAEGVRELLLAGKVPKTFLYRDRAALRPDARAVALLARLSDRRDDSILGAVADLLEAEGFRLLSQTALTPELVAPEGPLGRIAPEPEQWDEIAFAWPIARALGELDIGQTVVVHNRAVMALEAIEGTDETIRRGGVLSGPGACVVKLAKPRQDPRFDVPTVGVETLEALAEVKAAVLAIEARRTVVLGRDEVASFADGHGIAVVGVTPERLSGGHA
jgi:DUF1009 family protein